MDRLRRRVGFTLPGPEAGAEPDPLPPGKARRRDGTVVDVMGTLGGSRKDRKDPEGMVPDVPWYPVL